MLFKRVLAVLVLLCTTVESQRVKKNSSFSTEWNIDNRKKESSFGYIKAGKNSHNLAVIACGNYVEGATHTDCELTLRTHEFSGKTTTKSCKLRQPFRKTTHLYTSYSLIPADKVMITFTEDLPDDKLRLDFRIVNLTDCQSSNVSIISDNTYDFYFHKIVQHENSFDVVFKNSRYHSNYCITSYNLNGQLIKPVQELGRIVSNDSFNDIFIIDRIIYPNSVEDYFVIDKIGDKIKFIFSPTATKQQISAVDSYTYANNSGIARVCWQSEYLDPNILCSQLNAEGSVTNVSIKLREKVQLLKIYNLPDGNFLAMVKIVDFNANFDQFHVILVQADGSYEEVGKIMLSEMEMTDSVTISENAENVFCFSFLITTDVNPSETHIKFYTKCLPNTD